MGLRIYNTLKGEKEKFKPVEEGQVKIYSCGPTVYDYFHIGNARAFVVPDIIKRYLELISFIFTNEESMGLIFLEENLFFYRDIK